MRRVAQRMDAAHGKEGQHLEMEIAREDVKAAIFR